ncbi:MAG: ECF transporter S component, partial [Defluviitaleaceae bacterium]|nr:ECF transporter S component [Defluviitaleaceae bacterium]
NFFEEKENIFVEREKNFLAGEEKIFEEKENIFVERKKNFFAEKKFFEEEENFFPSQEKNLPAAKNKISRRAVSAAIFFLTIPATIFFGLYFLDDRQFYFISTLIIFQTMLPFALIYEGRKPAARELVIVAVLCALAVAARAAFFMLPQFKPVLALIIISGVALGGETGFLIGATVAFVSNMYFGQGPWTPWQMFAFGIIGFLSGVFFRTRLRNPIVLSIFGGIAAFFVYGGIMNPASVLIFQPQPTLEMFVLAFLYGAPFDFLHAVATFLFLLLISRPMLEKLDRIKNKFDVKNSS